MLQFLLSILIWPALIILTVAIPWLVGAIWRVLKIDESLAVEPGSLDRQFREAHIDPDSRTFQSGVVRLKHRP